MNVTISATERVSAMRYRRRVWSTEHLYTRWLHRSAHGVSVVRYRLLCCGSCHTTRHRSIAVDRGVRSRDKGGVEVLNGAVTHDSWDTIELSTASTVHGMRWIERNSAGDEPRPWRRRPDCETDRTLCEESRLHCVSKKPDPCYVLK